MEPSSAARPAQQPVIAPRLRRSLKLWDLIIIGIVIIQPIAPMGAYGIISNSAGGHVATTVLIAMIAVLLTAIAYGRMARVYPSAGSAYTYVGSEIHPAAGYLTGWAMVMDYILNPLICTILCSKLTQNVIHWPYWLLAVLFAAFFSTVNLAGIKTSARLNDVLTMGMIIVVIIFFAFVVRTLWGIHEYGTGFFTRPFYNPETFNLKGIFQGTSLAVLTYIGFDGISTLSEDVENPRRNVLLATVLVCLITGILSSLEVYAAQLIWGNKLFPKENVESAFPLIAKEIGGYFLFHLLNFTILIANIGSGMASQLAAARLLYGMGRGNALPSRFFGFITPGNQVPRNNVLLIGVVALAGAFALSYERGVELLNFGAFIAFMGVNAAAFVHYYLRAPRKRWLDLLLHPVGLLICGFMWWNLSRQAKIWGTIWLVLGISYAAWRTRGFRTHSMKFDIPAEQDG